MPGNGGGEVPVACAGTVAAGPQDSLEDGRRAYVYARRLATPIARAALAGVGQGLQTCSDAHAAFRVGGALL